MFRISSVFFIVCEKYLFWFYRSVGFEGNVKYAIKKELHQPWNALTLQVSLSLRDKLDGSLCKFIFTEATITNLFAILRVFLVGLGN